MTESSRLPTLPRQVPLDPRHEITAAPTLETLMPEGVPNALQLSAPAVSVQSAIAILLRDELKLADQADEPLRHHIEEAIALLELSTA